MSTESANVMRWDGRPGHYEVWYATFNHRRSGAGFWIRYTLRAPQAGRGEPTCALWFAYFDAKRPRNNVALNRELPISALVRNDAPFSLRVGDHAELTHGSLRGALEGGPGDAGVRWDVHYEPSSFAHRHLPERLYGGSFPATKVISPNPMIHVSGEITVGDKHFELDDERGCQSHLWGTRHAHAWAWAHCSAFREDPTAALEAVSARVKGPAMLSSPPLTSLSLYFGGEVYHFNELYTVPLTRSRWKDGELVMSAYGKRVRIEAELRARPEDMVRAHYRDPDGETVYCHNTEVADAIVTLWTRRTLLSSFRQTARLTSRATAHFEYGGHRPDERVKRLHERIVGRSD